MQSTHTCCEYEIWIIGIKINNVSLVQISILFGTLHKQPVSV